MPTQQELYGLKQTPHIWYQTFVVFMLACGFTRLHKDRCVFIKAAIGTFTIVSLYVDDPSIFAPTMKLIDEMKQLLHKRFKTTDLGEVQTILGWQVERNHTIFLHQADYCHKILGKFEMTACHAVGTRMEASKLHHRQHLTRCLTKTKHLWPKWTIDLSLGVSCILQWALAQT